MVQNTDPEFRDVICR